MSKVEFGFLNDLVGFWLKQAHAQYTADSERRLRTLDLSPQQFSVLALILLNPGIIQSRVMDSLYLSRSTCGDMIEQLIRKGLIRRDPIDRRSFGLGLTQDGATRLAEARQLLSAVPNPTGEKLSADEQQDLLRLLAKLSTP